MTIRGPESAKPTDAPVNLRFIVAAVDGCAELEWAVHELSAAGSPGQNIQTFYAHQNPVHFRPAGLPFGQLQVTLQYLEDLLGLDASTSLEYGEYWTAGRHILLANVYQDNDAETVAAILGRARSHAGRILGYGQAAKLPALSMDDPWTIPVV